MYSPKTTNPYPTEPLLNNDAVCGNNVVEANEDCVYGNTQSGDGCSALCQNY
ncbi:MAG: hypothetical protein D6780_02710 [Candidatus Dadabacteria bacterium]|nr:MAG: hypothetical protein D6780_02710 [Candidatus Dadabacteria bacterium]